MGTLSCVASAMELPEKHILRYIATAAVRKSDYLYISSIGVSHSTTGGFEQSVHQPFTTLLILYACCLSAAMQVERPQLTRHGVRSYRLLHLVSSNSSHPLLPTTIKVSPALAPASATPARLLRRLRLWETMAKVGQSEKPRARNFSWARLGSTNTCQDGFTRYR